MLPRYRGAERPTSDRDPGSRRSKVASPWRTGRTGVRRVLYPAYEARVVRRLPADRLPQHVGVMLDGNRRWARAVGADTAHGHRAGAANIAPFLGWCEEVGIEVVTLWLLSTDNLNRPAGRARARCWRSSRRPSTSLADRAAVAAATRSARSTCCPPRPPGGSRRPPSATRDVDGMLVNIAVGYGGRREIADAVRSPAARARLARHLDRGARRDPRRRAHRRAPLHQGPARPRPGDPHLGEQRLGGFLLWQSAHSEFYFCEAYWPDFRRVDFLRALRAYAERERRFGVA